MSYRAKICFKTVREGEMNEFFLQLKKATTANLDKIAKDEFLFMPSIRNDLKCSAVDFSIKLEADIKWAMGCLFSFRFFYLPEHNLLGVFNIPSRIEKEFDTVCYFQNSCDQDYESDCWVGVPLFEEIAKKWERATEKEVTEYYEKRYGKCDEEVSDYDYYRRSFAYDEIWDAIGWALFNEESVVYLSLFGVYEEWILSGFCEKCKKHYAEWLKELEDGR